MGWKKLFKRTILGTSLPNEYICATPGSLQEPLHAYLRKDGEEVDVTDSQILLGYSPVALGFAIRDPGLAGWLGRRREIRLSFRQSPSAEEIAWLTMERMSDWRMGEINLMIYKGLEGRHTFLGGFHQSMNRIYEKFRPANPDNAPTSIYDLIRIAYSIPRNVSVISLGDGSRFNFFPTDLHGEVGDHFYAGSLRKGGKAGDQVERFGKVAISKVGVGSYRDTYALGKNHMRDLDEITRFATAQVRSREWGLPLPQAMISYKELQLKKSLDMGIHNMYFYEVINEELLDASSPPLAHIHRFYAQWRIGRHLNTEYFFR